MRVVAIGNLEQLAGYALAGVEVIACDTPEAALRAAETLSDDVGLVLITSEAGAVTKEAIALHAGVVSCLLPT
jgi:vacuolar-type H+-ATPase subunit F/Vma7